MKDVFISHSSNDKPLIDPLVSAFQKKGLTYWYDILEVIPGDSLSDKISHGLRNSKIILFCLSENFIAGEWTNDELKAAFELAKLSDQTSILVPLLMCEPKIIKDVYPASFADLAYVRYNPNASVIVSEIEKVLSKVNNLGKYYWFNEGLKAYENHNISKSLMCLQKALEYDKLFLQPLLLYMKILTKNGEIKHVANLLKDRTDKWNDVDVTDLDINLLDEMQEFISRNITSSIMDSFEMESSYGIKSSINDFLYLEVNRMRSWRYYIGLITRKEFQVFQEDFMGKVLVNGKGLAADYFIDLAFKAEDSGLKKRLADIYYILLTKNESRKDDILNSVRSLLKDEDEDVRASALMPYYYFGLDGVDYVYKSLRAKSPEERYTSLILLTNKYQQVVTDDWLPGERIEGVPDVRLTKSVVKELLIDPSEVVREEVQRLVHKGILPKTKANFFDKLFRMKNEDEEERKVEKLAENLTVENTKGLMEFALNSPFKSVRREAVESLSKSDMNISDDYLKSLYEKEETKDVKQEIEELIIEKGSKALLGLISSLLEKRLSSKQETSSYFYRQALEKILREGSEEETVNIINLFSVHGLQEIIAANILFVSCKLNNELLAVFTCGFSNLEFKKALILAAGKYRTHLKDIEKELISSKKRDRIAAMRALAHNNQRNTILDELRTELEQFLSDPEKYAENDGTWAAIDASDGIIEFSGKQDGLNWLKRLYTGINPEWGFPLRQIWERMKILGHIVPNERFEKAGDMIPDGWTNNETPIYGVKE